MVKRLKLKISDFSACTKGKRTRKMESRQLTLSELAGDREESSGPVVKIAPSKMSEGAFKEKKVFEGAVGFQPKMEEQPTGCGGTTYKAVGAFTDTKDVQRNPALSARIDDDFSSCRTPLQVS